MKDNTQDWGIKAILHEADALLPATAKLVSMISAVRETPDSTELLDNAVLDVASYCQRVCGFVNELHYQLDVVRQKQ